jgi:hypothetical protein
MLSWKAIMIGWGYEAAPSERVISYEDKRDPISVLSRSHYGMFQTRFSKLASISALELTKIQRYKKSIYFLYKLSILEYFGSYKVIFMSADTVFSTILMETQSAVRMASRNDYFIEVVVKGWKGAMQFPFICSFHIF